MVFAPSFAFADDLFSNLKVSKPGEIVNAPEFTLKNLKHQAISLSDFDDQVVLLNFWATFCRPCLQEMPAMERLWQSYRGKGLSVVAIAVEEGREHAIQGFVDKHNLTFPILIDDDEQAADAYEVSLLPVSYLIKQGKIVGRATGERHWDSPEARLLFQSLVVEAAH